MNTSYDFSVSSIIQNIRNAYPAEYRIAFKFGECTIELNCNRTRMIKELMGYFTPFITVAYQADIEITVHEAPSPSFDQPFTVKQPDPGKTKIKEEYINLQGGRAVRKRLTDMVFIFGSDRHLAIGPCLANMNQVVNFVNNRYIEWELCRGSQLGHAAGILWKGKGLALAGFSGTGKSTLCLHLMSLGATMVSNDRLMMAPQNGSLMMRGVAKLPRINPGTILNNPDLKGLLDKADKEKYLALPAEELWTLEHKYDVPVAECFGENRFILNAPMSALAILNWKFGEGAMQVQKVSLDERRDLLPAFMKSTGLFFLPYENCQMPEPSQENYLDCLNRIDVIEFSGCVDFDQAAETCLMLLETGAA